LQNYAFQNFLAIPFGLNIYGGSLGYFLVGKSESPKDEALAN
jgi:hypothetical protein